MVSFQTKKTQFGYILKGLGIENLVLVISNILLPLGTYIYWVFGNFVVIWYIFPPALVYCTRKNLATLEGKKWAKK
jgi:hypothetical protein